MNARPLFPLPPADGNLLRHLYVDQHLSVEQVAARIGLSHSATLARLAKAGIRRRPQRRYVRDLRQRVLAAITATPTGCWQWTGTVTDQGYGTIWVNGKNRKAHRVTYEMFVGPIPDGLTLDHLCRNRPCVNPEHLEPVTQLINNLRGDTLGARNLAKTHCPRNHPYDAENTEWYRGHRYCRACRHKT